MADEKIDYGMRPDLHPENFAGVPPVAPFTTPPTGEERSLETAEQPDDDAPAPDDDQEGASDAPDDEEEAESTPKSSRRKAGSKGR